MDRLTFLMGLMVSCPYNETEDDCPFKDFRNYPIDKLISQCYSMDMEQSMQIIEKHKKCLQRKKQLLNVEKKVKYM